MQKVDKNIPIPDSYERGRPRIYPWREMEIGDSFFIEDNDSKYRPVPPRAKWSIGMKFMTRKVEGGFRVWRIK